MSGLEVSSFVHLGWKRKAGRGPLSVFINTMLNINFLIFIFLISELIIFAERMFQRPK
jgi:hypothetical protein